MTRTLRALLFFHVIVIAATAEALTVTLDTHHEYCGGANGYVTASVMGGVPPYTYVWSNGPTTESINNLAAGSYSVVVTDFEGTQASDGTTVMNLPSFPLTDIGGARAYCPTVDPGDIYSVFGTISLQESNGNWMLPMLPPFTVQGGLTVIPLGTEPWADQMVIYGLPEPPEGGTVQVTYTDANGCPGDAILHVGYAVDFPTISVLDVQGACASAANGKIQIALTTEGHGQIVDLQLKRASGQVVDFLNTGWVAGMEEFTGLLPGDYWLVLRTRSLGNESFPQMMWSLCGDSIMVNVPDLGPACGNVNGTVYMDYNEDCVPNAGDVAVPGALLEFTPGPYYATAGSGGVYSINLPSGAFSMQQIATDITQYCPAPPATVNVSGVQTINVADTALVPLDAQVMIANGAARPGFVLQYAIQQSNLTPATTGATSTVMTFDPSVTFITAYPAPSFFSGNTLTWNQTALGAFQQRTIQVQFQVPPEVGLIGTVLNASVVFTTANTDVVPANNSASTSVTISASFDPNEKTVQTSSQWSNELYYIDVDEWIDYTIRFQNTGTDTAFTVIITDTLPATLDPATIQWGAASHSCMRSLSGQGVVKFIFPNILLPDSGLNEPASHGFASFRIRPRLPLAPTTEIENVANIFFDFNPPVITEPSVLTAEFSTQVDGPSTSSGRQVVIAPNPASDLLRIANSSYVGGVASWSILQADGRIVRSSKMPFPSAGADISDLADGSYLLQLNSPEGSFMVRFSITH